MIRTTGSTSRNVKAKRTSLLIYQDMIANVLPKKGMVMSKVDLYEELLRRFGGNRFKAAGSMGGGTAHKYIEFDGTNYSATRNAHA